jgi:F-type H+-transporting ATPase subunit a
LPKLPKIGCLGIILLVLVLLVLGGLFLGVPRPALHLAPGNLFTAKHPHHWTKTDSDWADKVGVVDMEIKVQTEDKKLEADEPLTLFAKPDKAENMPANPVYEWRFLIDEKEVDRISDAGATVQYTFPEKGDLAVEVRVTDADTNDLVVGAALNEHEKSAFPITNTMITAWITVIVLIAVVYFGMRKRALVPRGLQNFIEAIFEWLINFVENAAGRENGRRFFPVVATIFIFVITNAYLALFPLFNVIGWGHNITYETPFFGEQSGFAVTTPLFRSANTDVNLPLALALMSFIFVEFWGISSLGFRHYVGKFIRIKPVFKSFGKPMEMMMAFIQAFVGFIEAITEVMRIVSFTFRLFGNMTAGEVLLMMVAFLMPLFLAVPFYGLELLIGFIQAIVFAGLTLGFAMVAVMPHEEESH